MQQKEKNEQPQELNEGYTQREWDRTVGIGEVPDEYKKAPRMTIDQLERLYDRG